MTRPTLSPLLHLLVASVVPAAAACSTDRDPTSMPERVACPATLDTNFYANLTLAPGIDGAVFRSVRESSPAVDGGAPTNVGTLGDPCGGASKRDECLAKVDAAKSTLGWDYASFYSPAADRKDYGVVTTGDTVRTIVTLDELRATVAPIESGAEALGILLLSNQRVTCTGNNARTEPDGWVFQYVGGGCGGPKMEYLKKVDRQGNVTLVSSQQLSEGDPNCVEGRRPAGFTREGAPSWLASLPAHLAEIAHMEAAAVIAFEQLARDLAAHGAPRELLLRIDESREDEIVHARIFRELAEAAGAEVAPVQVREPSEMPSLLALAIDNAVEGCARETYGALVALHQARTAQDPALRATFERIAEDEARHAALSFDLAAWFSTRLGEGERELVTRAHARALRDPAIEILHEPSPEVCARAGMPSPLAARALLSGLSRTLPLPRAA